MKFSNANIFITEEKRFAKGSITFDNCITDIQIGDTEGGEDLGGKYIIPGLIDVHTHGRYGADFMTSTLEECNEGAKKYLSHGVTTLYPCVMTADIEDIFAAIEKIKNLEHINVDGIHIEGPYVSPKRPGCHIIEKLRRPDVNELSGLCFAISPKRVHITIAPEIPGADEFIDKALALGCTLGIGHSDADYNSSVEAVKRGCVSFTHTYNAMRPLNHREPGTVGAALVSGAYAEFICDGFHVHKDAIDLAYRCVGNDRFVLVSDSISAADMPDGVYTLADSQVTVKGIEVRNEEGVIAGSALNIFDAVKNLARFAHISFEEALISGTKNPAKMVGIYSHTGSLDKGKRADMCVLDENGNIERVFVSGRQFSE